MSIIDHDPIAHDCEIRNYVYSYDMSFIKPGLCLYSTILRDLDEQISQYRNYIYLNPSFEFNCF